LGHLQTIYSEFPKFHPNPFTSGGVIAERVNIVQTHHKVFAILGEASASLPSNERYIPEHQNKLNIYDLQNYEFFCEFFSTKKFVKFVKF